MTASEIPGRQAGRERHVLPEVDGALHPPAWLAGLEHQRAWAAQLAAEMTVPRWSRLAGALPVVARVAAVGAVGAVGGIDA
ncbi:MAG: hypothetical protein ACRD03_16920, partial [Acidimicrobiales bacterium]